MAIFSGLLCVKTKLIPWLKLLVVVFSFIVGSKSLKFTEYKQLTMILLV